MSAPQSVYEAMVKGMPLHTVKASKSVKHFTAYARMNGADQFPSDLRAIDKYIRTFSHR
jgi:hypothetical protein